MITGTPNSPARPSTPRPHEHGATRLILAPDVQAQGRRDALRRSTIRPRARAPAALPRSGEGARVCGPGAGEVVE
ncbi:hypothetical protein [Candidatus Chloroploca asiatica]|uniref:hypothetical protein n=1 Tax=Candidatus Chloroploca asiatica TaxID=1506545 RepID=UPI001141BA40|nr:hypothetical protein [Candidatus Chloroploca asiatica]